MADQPTSRRSFLFGRSLRQEDPWLRFLARLKRSCLGELSLINRDGPGLARLVPARIEDVQHARALCHEYGVCMALDGVPLGAAEQARAVLSVEAGRTWGNAVSLGEGLWRVDAGCPLPVLRAMGVYIADERSQTRVPVENFAQWLAMLQVNAPMGDLARYGIQAIECLYPDGSLEVLGQFGVKDSKPLRSLAAQRAIPALFQCTRDPHLQRLLQQVPAGHWPLRYRLDAVMGVEGASVNLAHLFLGHRATLGWIVAAHVNTVAVAATDHTNTSVVASQSQAVELDIDPTASQQTCREIEQTVKRAMDPSGLYMSSLD